MRLNPIKSLRERQQKQAAEKSKRERHAMNWRILDSQLAEDRSSKPYQFKPQGSGIQRLLPPVHP